MADWSQQWYTDQLSIAIVDTEFCGLAMTENPLYKFIIHTQFFKSQLVIQILQTASLNFY